MKIALRCRPSGRAIDTSLIKEGKVYRGTIDNVDLFVLGTTRGEPSVNVETGEIIPSHTVLMDAEHMPEATMLPYGREIYPLSGRTNTMVSWD